MRQRNLTGVWTKIGQNDRIKSEKNGQINRTKSGTKNGTKLGQNSDKRNRAKNAEEEIWTRNRIKKSTKIG